MEIVHRHLEDQPEEVQRQALLAVHRRCVALLRSRSQTPQGAHAALDGR